MHWKAEEALEAEAEFKMERHGGRGFPLHNAYNRFCCSLRLQHMKIEVIDGG